MAGFFNSISSEYTPLQDKHYPESQVNPEEQFVLEPYQVSGRLKAMRKPSSQVRGDIAPRLVTLYHDFLALPLIHIFNSVFSTHEWPAVWSLETIIVTPKNSAPKDLSECQTLSCTPLFSKALESFVLDRLLKETKLSPTQYGGIKGCGTDHFLVKTWDAIISGLRDPRATINLLSIDFEKAFHRVDHYQCLKALRKSSASTLSSQLVYAFLKGRRMSVKIGETMSEERPVNGGSPQGSILGNFLFCICSDELDRGLQDQPSILNNGPEDENSEDSPPRSTHSREESEEQPTGVDLGLARIVTDRPSSLGVNNIAVVADQLELCVPFERNGVRQV